MALENIEAELVGGIPHQTCAVCYYLAERDEEWGARLRRMLANTGVRFKDLACKMEADPEEPTIPWETLSRHARAGCSAREHLR